MMSKKEKIFTLCTNSLALLLALAVVIPFGATSIGNFEIVFKFVIAPIVACAIFLVNSYVKYIVGSNAYKYTTFSQYVSVFSYVIAILVYTLLAVLRVKPEVVYELPKWIAIVFVLVVAACLVGVIAIFTPRFIILTKTRENVILDMFIFILVIAIAAALKSVVDKHMFLTFDSHVLQFVALPGVIALAVVTFVVFIMLNYVTYEDKFTLASRKELIKKWHDAREDVYRQAEVDILYNLYEFSKKELGIEEVIVFDDEEEQEDLEEESVAETESEEKVEEVVEETVVEEAPIVKEEVIETKEAETVQEEVEPKVVVEEVIEEVVQTVDEEEMEEVQNRISELLKSKEDLTKVEEVETVVEVKTSLPPKKFKPTFAEMVRYAQSFKNVTYQANEEGTVYKFFVDKNIFLILNDTPRDYRLTFLMDIPDASIYAQSVSFSKAKTPKSEYSFKLVSKGEYDEPSIKNIIKGSYNMVEIIKERIIAEKEALKAQKAEEKLQAKLATMTPEDREKYLARLEKKRMLDAMTPEERKAMEEAELKAKAEKEALKQAELLRKQQEKEEALKAKEKAKEEALKAKEKAKEEALKAKEKAKEEALKAKEKEREAALKAKEKEREAALKAKEKEKAKLALEKQKAKEKEAALKAKEKEKEAALKAKEKEKAKLALEKQKAKEKEAAQKAKEKEKAKLALEKQKAKEKEAAQKAKEKEKAKLALEKQKAKEKEAALKAKEKEKAKLALEKQKAKEKEAALKAKEQEQKAA